MVPRRFAAGEDHPSVLRFDRREPDRRHRLAADEEHIALAGGIEGFGQLFRSAGGSWTNPRPASDASPRLGTFLSASCLISSSRSAVRLMESAAARRASKARAV